MSKGDLILIEDRAVLALDGKPRVIKNKFLRGLIWLFMIDLPAKEYYGTYKFWIDDIGEIRAGNLIMTENQLVWYVTKAGTNTLIAKTIQAHPHNVFDEMEAEGSMIRTAQGNNEWALDSKGS